jgi:hypothetical protein
MRHEHYIKHPEPQRIVWPHPRRQKHTTGTERRRNHRPRRCQWRGQEYSLLAVSGLIKANAGKILFEGEDLTTLSPHQIVQKGVVQVAEGRAILTTLTVQENLDLGATPAKIKRRSARIWTTYFICFRC